PQPHARTRHRPHATSAGIHGRRRRQDDNPAPLENTQRSRFYRRKFIDPVYGSVSQVRGFKSVTDVRLPLLLNNFSTKIRGSDLSHMVSEIRVVSSDQAFIQVFLRAQYGHEQRAAFATHRRPLASIVGHAIFANLDYRFAHLWSFVALLSASLF